MRLPCNSRLAVLAFFLAALYLGPGFSFLSKEEQKVWITVRNGQAALWEKQAELGIEPPTEEDRLRTGLIGVEWSQLTTTLGDIRAKRTSCNPLWAVQYLDWFDELGLKEGDPIAIYSSSSFPALLFSALAAAESRGLDILLSVSLGSSMWGANRAEFPWPSMAETLRDAGFIRTDTSFYTPGGGGESGGGFSKDTMLMLKRLADEESVPLFTAGSLDEMIAYKAARIAEHRPKLLISIGGSNANMGDSELAPEIPEGLILPPRLEKAEHGRLGGGVIADALESGIPVLHMLNMKKLSLECGIPWDPGFYAMTRMKFRPLSALLGVIVFLAVLFTHRRWRMEDI